MPGIDAYIEQLREGLSQARSLTPIEITMQMMSMNVFVGSLLAIPTALFVMKRPPATLSEEDKIRDSVYRKQFIVI